MLCKGITQSRLNRCSALEKSNQPCNSRRAIRLHVPTPGPARHSRLLSAATDVGTASDAPESAATERLTWFEKPSAWRDMPHVDDIKKILNSGDGKWTAIDLYAGWCSCCRSAYPALCKIPVAKTGNGWQEKYHFLKANIEHESVALFIKENGVRGIPHILVFGPNGKKIIGFGASFKKMDSVKRNLETICTSEDQDFVLDPVGHVVCRNSAWSGAAADSASAAL